MSVKTEKPKKKKKNIYIYLTHLQFFNMFKYRGHLVKIMKIKKKIMYRGK